MSTPTTRLYNRFIHLTYSESASTTIFTDSSGYFHKLNGQTADEAELVSWSGNISGCKLIPPEAVVFVDFPDGTTGIITHLKFYSKLSDLGGSGSSGAPGFGSIKVYEYQDSQMHASSENRLPHDSNEDLGFNEFDVVAFINTYTGTLNNFELAVCTGVDRIEYSGEVSYTYWWQPMFSWPEWETAQSNMTAGN